MQGSSDWPRGTRLASILALAAFAALAWWHMVVFRLWAGAGSTPDAMFAGYGPHAVRAWLDALDTGERAYFLFWHAHLFDMAFPPLAAAALTMLTLKAGLFHGFLAGRERARAVMLAAALPFAYWAFDYLENVAVAHFVAGRIAVNPASAHLASVMTGAKYLFGLFALALPAGLWLHGRNRRSGHA